MREGYTGVAAAALLLLCVLVAPWLFGAVQYWAQLVALAILLLAVPVSILHGLVERKSAGFSATLVAILILLGIGLLQLLFWSPTSLESLSPKAYELRVAFGEAAASFQPLSLNPAVTRSIVVLLSMAALVVVVANRSVSSVLQRPILLAVAANGAILSLLAVWQRVWGDNLVYGVVPVESGFPVGPFVNRNNAAGYLLMCLAAGIATVLLTVASMQSTVQSETRTKHRKPDYQMLIRNPVGILALCSCGLIVLGILLTQSRGGCMALFLGGCAALFITTRRNHLGVLAGTIALTTIIPILLLVLADQWMPATERLSTLGDQNALSQESRLSIWGGALEFASDFFWTGAGLGTFRYVYPLYDHAPGAVVVGHAENQFIELLCEAGIIGVLGIAVAVVLFGFRLIDQLAGGTPRNRALAGAGLFFLVSQIIANCFDFGLAIPANLLLCCFLIGTFESSFRHKKQNSRKELTTQPGRFLQNAVAIIAARRSDLITVGLLLLACFGAADLMRASSIESIPVAELVDAYESPVAEENIKLQLDRIGRNIHLRWDDAEAHYVIAESLVRLFEANNLGTPEGNSSIGIAQLSDLAKAVQLSQKSSSADATAIVPPELREQLEPIREHLLLARQACCLNPKVHLRLAHLAFLEDSDKEVEHLDRVARIVEGNRYKLFAQGKELYQADEFEAAFALWKNCLEKRSRYDEAIVALASSDGISVEQLSTWLFPDRREFYEDLLNVHYASAEHSQRRNQVLALMNSKFGSTN